MCVRFTSLAAWIPIGLAISFRSGKITDSPDTKKNNYYRVMSTLFGCCVPFGFFGVLLGCCMDRWFYGFWAVPFLGNIHFNVLLGETLESAIGCIHYIVQVLVIDVLFFRLRPWITLWDTSVFMVCIRWYSCHLWDSAALLSLGYINNQQQSTFDSSGYYISIHRLALIFRTQGISLFTPDIASHLHFGGSCFL